MYRCPENLDYNVRTPPFQLLCEAARDGSYYLPVIYLRACMYLSCLTTYRPTSLHTYLPAYLPTYLPK